ncbi:hypothetical protein PIIN_06868 [Serendipita indica DSM 11827]|uniref:Uncharacterized protein n=1 Tax=Serendipita indica (strain DSM 11827) TaxID=1109443 RepID=G4TNN9_SERID|nr:hypothetical protein PIIN_06868 [Serendipita indica DSM 11827]
MHNTQPLRPPSVLLPPVKRALMLSTAEMEDLVSQLAHIYTPQVLGTQFTVATPQIKFSRKGGGWVSQKKSVSVHDSGYTSVVVSDNEDDSEDDDYKALQAAVESLANTLSTAHLDVPSQTTELDTLRADEFERTYAMKWLTGLVSFSEEWIDASSGEDDGASNREAIVEKASALLAACSGSSASGAVTRSFTFAPKFTASKPRPSSPMSFQIQLKDDSLPSQDHTAVGLQTWGSAPILCQLISDVPSRFGLDLARRSAATNGTLRILELGAGTGLLSLFLWRLLEYQMLYVTSRSGVNPWNEVSILATDYHPSVLSNLAFNLELNRPAAALHDGRQRPTLLSKALDWVDCPEVEDSEKYDIIFGADIVYEPEHAPLIKAVVEKVLKRPSGSKNDDSSSATERRGGIFWLMYPIRPTHSAEVRSIAAAFAEARSISSEDTFERQGDWTLGVLESQHLERRKGIGRADEVTYCLLKIGWV